MARNRDPKGAIYIIPINFAEILQSYATGAVSGGSESDVGGLVGDNGDTIAQTYAVGLVTAGSGSTVGGLVGNDQAKDGTITSSYWDMGTTGITNPSQGEGNVPNDSGITGDDTGTLQSALSAGFDSTVWAIVPGVSYPYLQWQVPTGTPQVVAGIIGNGSTPIVGASVGLLIGGAAAGTPLVATTAGANGYYYKLLAPGTIPDSNSQVLAYIASGAPRAGNAYYQDATGSLTSLNIQDGEIEITTDQADSSGITSGLNTAIGSQTGSQFVYTQAGGYQSGIDVAIFTDSSFTIDSTLDFTGDHLTIGASGSVDETTGAIDAKQLVVNSIGDISLTGANDIAYLSDTDSGGAGDIDVNDTALMRLNGLVNAGSGMVTLTSGGKIEENAKGAIDAGAFAGSSAGGASLNGANMIGTLDAFTNTGAGSVLLDDGEALTVSGAVGAGAGHLTLSTASGDLGIGAQLTAGDGVDLVLDGTIAETVGGAIATGTLTGSSAGGATLDGANLVDKLGAFANSGAGGFALTDGKSLTMNGTVAGGTGDTDITLVHGNLTLTGAVSGGSVTLDSERGDVNQTAGTIAAADVLTVDAITGIVLDNDNTYTTENLHSKHGTVTGH